MRERAGSSPVGRWCAPLRWALSLVLNSAASPITISFGWNPSIAPFDVMLGFLFSSILSQEEIADISVLDAAIGNIILLIGGKYLLPRLHAVYHIYK